MIVIKKLCKSFGSKVIFRDFDLEIKDGEFIFLSGESGCGKTTLLNMIGGIEQQDSGIIEIDGNSVTDKKFHRTYYKTIVGFLFQNFALMDDKTVKANLDIVKNSCRTSVSNEEALEFVGLSDKINQYVYTLSGGEQQRVALARLLVKKCNIILADEPTGSLDRKNADIVMELLDKLNKIGKTVIVVTHDEKAVKMGKRVVYL